MDKKVANIKDRVLYISELKGIKREDFFNELGLSYANFKGVQKKSALNSDAIDKILTIHDDISAEWILTGRGEMLKTNISSAMTEDNQGLPLISTDAMAGFGSGSQQIMDYDTKRYKVPEFTELNAEFMIRVKGSSMYPKYNSGDLLACKKISMSFFQWNKVYVLDTEQGALIKRIKPSEKDKHIKCVSDNKSYDPYDLHTDEINALAIVLGVIRLE